MATNMWIAAGTRATAVTMAVALAFGAWSAHAVAQSAPRARGQATPVPSAGGAELTTLHVQGNVYLIAGSATNIVVQIGSIGPVVVDTGAEADSEKVIAAIRALSDKPIRYIINTHVHAENTAGNIALAKAGASLQVPRNVTQDSQAEVIAHEEVLNRMSAQVGGKPLMPVGAWPTSTFSERPKELFTNGEAVQIIHQPAAHTDGDVVVFFRRSDVIAAGDIYSTVSYPVVDPERGGSIAGVLDGLNHLLALAIPGEKIEGGTMIVPGHGRISDEADLVEYRDMVTIVRDRVADLVKKGMTLEQVKAANPTLEYDGIYGKARGWTKDQFVEAVYRGLKPAPVSRNR